MTGHSHSIGVAALALLLVAGCDGTQRVGKHIFETPDSHLLPEDACCFFLPSVDHSEGGFIFYLNPDADLRERRTVLVQERAEICRRAPGREARVNATICAPAEVEWRGESWVRSGDTISWAYRPEGQSPEALFIGCFQMQIPDHPGMCSAVLPYGDLALTIDLTDDEVAQVDERYDLAVSLLDQWER